MFVGYPSSGRTYQPQFNGSEEVCAYVEQNILTALKNAISHHSPEAQLYTIRSLQLLSDSNLKRTPVIDFVTQFIKTHRYFIHDNEEAQYLLAHIISKFKDETQSNLLKSLYDALYLGQQPQLQDQFLTQLGNKDLAPEAFIKVFKAWLQKNNESALLQRRSYYT